MYSYRQVKNMILFKSFRCVFVAFVTAPGGVAVATRDPMSTESDAGTKLYFFSFCFCNTLKHTNTACSGEKYASERIDGKCAKRKRSALFVASLSAAF